MAYRDPTDAIRQRVELRREDVQAHGKRITEELIRQLPEALRAQLRQHQADAHREARDIAQWREVEQAVERYAEVVGQIYQLAPMLDERFQQIKRGHSKRALPRHYMFPDIYAQGVERLRQELHERLRALDGKARFFDTDADYFNAREHPFLVDAELRVRRVPIRLAVHAVMQNANQPYNRLDLVGYLASCHVPQGLPDMQLLPQGAADAALQWVGLQKDTVTGDPLFDKAYRVVQPADPATARVLDSKVRRALRLLQENSTVSQQFDLPALQLRGAVAQAAWLERGTFGLGLAPALALLRQLRKTRPPVLLRAGS